MAEFEIPDDLRYSDEDEWVRAEDGRIVVGITDYAQQQLGDIVFVELPEVGARFEKGAEYGVIESVKAVSGLFAPISGEIVDVNTALAERPEAVNESCYGEGWMIAFAGDADAVDALRDAESYRKYVEERSE